MIIVIVLKEMVGIRYLSFLDLLLFIDLTINKGTTVYVIIIYCSKTYYSTQCRNTKITHTITLSAAIVMNNHRKLFDVNGSTRHPLMNIRAFSSQLFSGICNKYLLVTHSRWHRTAVQYMHGEKSSIRSVQNLADKSLCLYCMFI